MHATWLPTLESLQFKRGSDAWPCFPNSLIQFYTDCLVFLKCQWQSTLMLLRRWERADALHPGLTDHTLGVRAGRAPQAPLRAGTSAEVPPAGRDRPTLPGEVTSFQGTLPLHLSVNLGKLRFNPDSLYLKNTLRSILRGRLVWNTHQGEEEEEEEEEESAS